MDNRHIDITAEGDEALALALRLVWPNAPGGKATHYKVAFLKETTRYYGTPTSSHVTESVQHPAPAPNERSEDEPVFTLILLWHEERDAVPLPYPLELDEAASFVKGWLKRAPFPAEPDHDGSNGKGWRVFNEAWGHVAGHHYAFAAIQPAWAMYGK